MYIRQLRNGNWILGQRNETPIVLIGSQKLNREQAEEYFYVNGFCIENSSKINKTSLKAEKTPNRTSIWIILRLVFWIIVTISSFYSLFTIIRVGMPSGSWWIYPDKNILLSLLVVIAIALPTSIIHEIGHMVFGNSKQVSIAVNRSVAKTKLNHVWGWSITPRIEAIVAGLGIDICCLAISLSLLIATKSWIFYSATATILVKILWQFGFHAHRDGRLLICVIKDNPIYFIDNTKYFPRVLKVVGILLDLFLLLWWPVKFLLLETHVF